MKKVAFVVQRYGLEVNGGSELYCRQMAEKLKDYYDIEVLTSCALDYVTWADYYEKGVSVIHGVKVHRFGVAQERNTAEFDKLSAELASHQREGREAELEWMDKQGPQSKELIEYIASHKDDYDAFVFFTYLYYTTFYGLQAAPEHSVLIPTAHDEWPIYFGIYQHFFKRAKAFFYNTVEEKAFVEKMFHVQDIMNNGGLGGVGIDLPETVDGNAFCEKYGVDDYIIYVGRIEESKGCKDLFEYYSRYKRNCGTKTKLVLLGRAVMELPDDPDIIYLGFVSDEDKFNGIAGSKLLVLPSPYESLSMVVLEAMSLGKPVLVNGKCEVLKGHCIRSNAGLYYTNYNEFEEKLSRLLDDEVLRMKMGTEGKSYIQTNYVWDVILARLRKLIDSVGR